MRLFCLLLVSLCLLGCSSASDYYRLEKWGDGWKLDVKEEKDRFTAKWVKGDRKSVELSNYDDSRESVTYINTLYLELDNSGNVTNGRLKRFITSKFERRSYEETHAQWFVVLGGKCVLDGNGKGTLDVHCQGDYVFAGNVVPANDLKEIKPE